MVQSKYAKELEIMIKSLTLKQAIAQTFDVDGRKLPEFTSSKPVQQAREWLERNGTKFDYQRNYLDKGMVIYAFGGGNPQYTVVETDADLDALKGAQVFGTLSVPKRGRKSKSQERRENAMKQADVNANIGAAQTSGGTTLSEPAEMSTQPDIDTLQNKETIVTDPEDSEN